jgi:hypothetical protein
MNKIISHLYIYSKKLNYLIIILNIHCPFVTTESTVWIFFIFQPSKICVSPTDVVSSISPPQCHLSSGQCRHATVPYHTSFPLRQDELDASTSSFDNASSYRLPSRVKINVLYLHHHRRPSFSDRPTLIFYYYRKVISILITLLTTQSCLYFVSSLARAPHHWSSTCRHRSLSTLFQLHHPSA